MIDYSSVDFIDLLENRLGLRNVQMTSGGVEIKFSCGRPDHARGDEKPSAYINSEKGAFHCQSCKFSGVAADLVADVQQTSRVAAERFLREIYGIEFNEPVGGSMATETELRFRERLLDPPRIAPPESWLSSVRLDWEAAYATPQPYETYMLDRGLMPSTLMDWDIGYDFLSNRMTIPVRDLDGSLMGVKGRDWTGKHPAKYCNTPEAPIWMADVSFKDLGDVEVGDVVMGWVLGDPVPGAWGRMRLTKHLAPSLVIGKSVRGPVPVVKIYMESGRTIRCTPDHQWLVHRGRLFGSETTDNNDHNYASAEIGGLLSSVVQTRRTLTGILDRDAVWLGGIFDGEGSSNARASVICQSKSHNPEVCRRIESTLDDLGLAWKYSQKSCIYTIKGGWQSAVDLANWCDPVRRDCLAKRAVGKTYFRTPDRVVAIEPDGYNEVVSLETETGNYVAWGYASKNCVLGNRDNGKLNYGFDTYEITSVVFGLHRAREHRVVMLLEGELDAIASSQLGVQRPVASGRAGLSPRQISLLVEECEEVVVYYDRGPAGEKATDQAVEALEPYLRVRVVEPLDVDPCDALKLGREDEVLRAIAEAPSSLQARPYSGRIAARA